MEFQELLEQRRTVRRFDQKPLAKDDFVALLEAARRASCGANSQVLRYIVIQNSELLAKILPHTHYAGRVKPHRDPVLGVTAPTGFIAVTAPTLNAAADAAAAIQSMEFAAWERGLGCCWVGAFSRPDVEEILEIPEGKTVVYLVAVGYRGEEPIMEDIECEDKVGYYLDEDDRLHVPKLTVEVLSDWR